MRGHIHSRENKEGKCNSFIEHACSQLADEIGAHKRLLQAEKGHLLIKGSTFHSTELLKEILKLEQPVQAKCTTQLSIDSNANDFEVTTDRVLLTNVVHSMVKDALEAENQDTQVVMNCQHTDTKAVFSIRNSTYMPGNIQLQIFQRSFSAKGKGRGIGTYSMKLYTEQFLEGKAWFKRCESKGISFFVSIPYKR